jgi:hypothetical protein
LRSERSAVDQRRRTAVRTTRGKSSTETGLSRTSNAPRRTAATVASVVRNALMRTNGAATDSARSASTTSVPRISGNSRSRSSRSNRSVFARPMPAAPHALVLTRMPSALSAQSKVSRVPRSSSTTSTQISRWLPERPSAHETTGTFSEGAEDQACGCKPRGCGWGDLERRTASTMSQERWQCSRQLANHREESTDYFQVRRALQLVAVGPWSVTKKSTAT